MSDSIHKKVIDAISARLNAIEGNISVETNWPVPQTVPDDGLIIVRDLVPEPTEETIGGFDTVYVVGYVPVEVYAVQGDSEELDVKYDELLQACSAALLKRDADTLRRLGGLVFGLWVDRPEPIAQDVIGAAPIKASTIKVHLEYQAETPLA
jgi:hypothetical protein